MFGFDFAGFCWSLEIIGVWVRFCWVLLVVRDHLCLGSILLGFVGRRRSSVFGFDFAGFLLVICGFCFGSGGWWVMGSEALLV